MDQAPLIVSIVAVVLGGAGLIGGVIGYVQGTTAVARATNARQRAVVAEEEALQARAAAEATARSAEELVERARESARSADTRVPVSRTAIEAAQLPQPTGSSATETGRSALPQTARPTALPQPEPAATGPVVVPTEWQPAEHFEIPAPATVVETRDADGPADGIAMDGPSEQQAAGSAFASAGPDPEAESVDADAAAAPDEAAPQPAVPAAERMEAPLDAVPEPASDARAPEDAADADATASDVPVGESGAAPVVVDEEPGSTAPADDPAEPSEDPGAPRDERGRVAAGAQDAPTMDWAEVLRTGAIPLPSRSRGTYAAPRRRPRPTGDGPARFELRAIGRQRFEAVNVGGEPAEEARIEGGGDDPHLIRPLSARPSTVQPAGTLAFSVLRVEGRHAAVAVTWVHAGEPVRQDLPLD